MQKNHQIRILSFKQAVMTKYRYLMKLSLISHTEKNRIFSKFLDQLPLPYKFHGSGIRYTLNFASCEPLID